MGQVQLVARSSAASAIARSWIARPVESKVVISSSVRRPSASPGEHGAELGHLVARERARLDRVDELAVVACLLPVVAEDVRPDELLDGDLRLSRPVGAHQADVLARPKRARAEQDLVAGRHRDDHVRRERLLA